jgi:hypothetical protein
VKFACVDKKTGELVQVIGLCGGCCHEIEVVCPNGMTDTVYPWRLSGSARELADALLADPCEHCNVSSPPRTSRASK